jgi:ABC-type nitrate/sulfonate/bicarbonate transport system permease component
MRALLNRVGWRGWVLPLGLLAFAEAAMRINRVESDALARPIDVLEALARACVDGSVFSASAQTLGSALAGLALGGGIGLAAGVWFGLSRAASDAASLSVELLRPVPSVALIPLAMLVFGFGFRMEVSVIAFTCFWPMLLLSQAAVRNVEPRLLEVARVLGFTWWERVVKLILPAALPRVFVAFRLCVGISLVVAVTVEIAANPQGLGYALMNAQQSLRPDLTFALLLWIGLLGWGLGAALLMLQRTWFRHSLAQQK